MIRLSARFEDGVLLPAASTDLALSGTVVHPPDHRPELERQNSFDGCGFEVTTLNDQRMCGHVSVSLSDYSDRYWPLANLERNLITL